MEGNNKVKRVLWLLLIVFLLLVAAFLFYFRYLVNSKAEAGGSKSVYNIEEGDSTWSISKDLKGEGYIKSNWAFFFHIKVKDKTIKAGSYLISPDMTIEQIAQKITSGDTSIEKITLPEGWRLEQIAQYLSQQSGKNYLKFVSLGEKYRGKLFPDTYFISKESDEEQIINMMYQNYLNRIGDLKINDDQLVLASLVEREARNDNERATIAGVYQNRLKGEKKLEADPTVFYANDSDKIRNLSINEISKYKFWQTIDFNQYQAINSKYNTYLYKGLPSEPICNPGLKSIESAISYQKHNYLFFFHDSEGNIYLSENEVEHEAKKKQYLN